MKRGQIIQYITDGGSEMLFVMLNEDKCAELVSRKNAANIDSDNGRIVVFVRPEVPATKSNGLEKDCAAVMEVIYGGLADMRFNTIGMATEESIEEMLDSLSELEEYGDNNHPFVRLRHIKDRIDDEMYKDKARDALFANNTMEFSRNYEVIELNSLKTELFCEAVKRNNTLIANACLNRGMYADTRMPDGKTALAHALLYNDLDLPRRLVMAGANLKIALKQLPEDFVVNEKIMKVLKTISERPVSEELKGCGLCG